MATEQFEQPEQFIKKPLSEVEMQQKLTDIRRSVGEKINHWADRVQVSMRFKPVIERHEGERWEENGKMWTIKDGIRQNITYLDAARMPHWCPRCSKSMSHRFDRKFYYLRGWCFNCNVEVEGQMRLDGTWDAFEKKMLRQNEKARIRDEIQERMDYMRTFKVPQIHFQDGRWEALATMNDFAGLFASLEYDIEQMVKRLEFLTKLDEDEANATMASKTENCGIKAAQ